MCIGCEARAREKVLMRLVSAATVDNCSGVTGGPNRGAFAEDTAVVLHQALCLPQLPWGVFLLLNTGCFFLLFMVVILAERSFEQH